jgi:predicted outer membrane repeat protein
MLINIIVSNITFNTYNGTYPLIFYVNCSFENNLAEEYGGAIFSRYFEPYLENVTFINNTALLGGNN